MKHKDFNYSISSSHFTKQGTTVNTKDYKYL